MSRAPLATRPDHNCCTAAAIRLETFSFCGRWSWRIAIKVSMGGNRLQIVDAIHVSHCPWCGVELPSARKPELREVGRDA